MAASVTLPPPGPVREFNQFLPAGRLLTRPLTEPIEKIRRAALCSDPCSPLLAPARPCSPLSPRLPRLPRTRAPASLRDYELHQLGSNQRPKRPRPERCTN